MLYYAECLLVIMLRSCTGREFNISFDFDIAT